jgi:hypothetical protein
MSRIVPPLLLSHNHQFLSAVHLTSPLVEQNPLEVGVRIAFFRAYGWAQRGG